MILEDMYEKIDFILSRDQRTTSYPVPNRIELTRTSLPRDKIEHREKCPRQAGVIEKTNHRNSHLPSNLYIMPKKIDDRGRLRARYRKTICSSTCLNLFVCLLVLHLAVLTQSGPVIMTSECDEPKWMNPCGSGSDRFVEVDELQEEPLDNITDTDDTRCLANVMIQAKLALTHVATFRSDYTSEVLRQDLDNMETAWQKANYDWLPGKNDIPKELGEELKKEYLETLNVSDCLKNTFGFMQRYAVGLEQITQDQRKNNNQFRYAFEKAESILQSVLCEMQTAMGDCGVTPPPNIGRDIMPDGIRLEPHYNLRDWIIFRDYINGLEYVHQVFSYLCKENGTNS